MLSCAAAGNIATARSLGLTTAPALNMSATTAADRTSASLWLRRRSGRSIGYSAVRSIGLTVGDGYRVAR